MFMKYSDDPFINDFVNEKLPMATFMGLNQNKLLLIIRYFKHNTGKDPATMTQDEIHVLINQ